MHFQTRAIHDGQEPDPQTGAVTVPVYQVSTFRQESVGRHSGYEYSRTGNPTREALETALASLEHGASGIAFASGVAATAAVLEQLSPGDHILACADLYGGTYRLMERVYRRWGLSISYVDTSDPDVVRDAMRPETKLLWIETPTNPLLNIMDIAALARMAHAAGAELAVDNTFASPFFQRPLEHGADWVVHSTTKYLGGHSDIIGGAVIAGDAKRANGVRIYQNTAGAVPGPWDCWLTLRGLKTLAVRMREHERNALRIARFLAASETVTRVYYPGLPEHPGHETARRQMDGFSGMVSFEIKGGIPEVDQVLSRLRLFTLAESLGGVESLVCHPARMTHASIPAKEREQRGIRDNLIRLSVGIEHGDDLEKDLQTALESA